MQEKIRLIVNEVPPEHVFDSHFVISELIKRFSDEYLVFVGQYTDSSTITLTAHQQIGHEINKLGGIQRVGESWSESIHRVASKCTCWRKL